ncbi:MAG: YihY/virulence factor BrkB family protein [Planctomycetes bacterium]|nr:YihY/virulence factor BrkB family protein [Planctomycetota bacterium]
MLSKIMFFFGFLKEVYKTMRDSNLSALAASIAYFMVLCLIPFLLVALSILGFILGGIDTAFSARIISFVRINQPMLVDYVKQCIEFATVNRDLLGIIGLAALLWTSKGVVFALEYGLDCMLGLAPFGKSYLRKLLDSVIMLFIVIGLFAFSMGLMVLANYATALASSTDFSMVLWEALGGFLSYVFALVISAILYYFIYRILPAGKLSAKAALLGALIGASIWQVINGFMGWYLAKQVLHYQFIYGSFATFIYIILWTYFFAMSILIGGAVIKVARDKGL